MPPPVTLQEFLANALDATFPSAQNKGGFNDLSKMVQGVMILNHVGSRVEVQDFEGVSPGAARPVFSLPAQVDGAISIYHHIGILRRDAPTAPAIWQVNVKYPQWREEMRLTGNEVDGESTSRLIDIMRLGSSTTDNEPTTYGLPLKVFPGGILSVERVGDVAAGNRVALRILREVVPGPLRTEGIDEISVAFV